MISKAKLKCLLLGHKFKPAMVDEVFKNQKPSVEIKICTRCDKDSVSLKW